MNYFEILEIEITNDDNIIKNAYKKLAKKYHPDLCKSEECEEKFKKINEAYEVLSDKIKRKEYIHKLKSGFNNPFGNFSMDFGDLNFNFNMNEIFKNVDETISSFNVKKYKKTKFISKNKDVEIEIPLEYVYYGNEIEKEIEYYIECSECDGLGGEVAKCPKCKGTSYITKFDGFSILNITCDYCNGKGVKLTKKCNKCNGKGFTKGKEKITIKIPKGITEKTKIRIKEKGNIKNKERGDLFIKLKIKPHDFIKREKNNLIILQDINREEIEKILKNEFNKTINYFNEKLELKSDMFKKLINNELIIKGAGFNILGKEEKGDLIIKFNFIF